MSGALKASFTLCPTRSVRAAFPGSAPFSGRSPLGRPANLSRTRTARRLPIVAVPALAGVAAAFAFSNAPVASALAAQNAPARHSAARPSAEHLGAAAAQLLSAAHPRATRTAARPATYTVKDGDTLSSIAKRLYQSPDFWPVLYWANHSKIKYANIINAGLVLTVPAKPARVPAPPSVLGPAPAPVAQPAPASAPVTTSADTTAQAAPTHASGTYSGASGSFQACVIARESGGNSQVMNATGHYGLYQFSSSTWAAYGGNPADFGNASVSEQNQVFNNAIAAGGQSNWSAYDGC